MKNIFILGDSTAAIKALEYYPETGWGEAFRFFLRKDMNLINLAVNGKSTKSFIEMGDFDLALEQIKKDDIIFIQFGHNDGKEDDNNRYTNPYKEYIENLDYMVRGIKEKEGIPILLTSCSRRAFENGVLIENNLGEYPLAMKRFAETNNLLLLDIFQKSKELLRSLGEKSSQSLYLILEEGNHKNYPRGIFDNTHFSPLGALSIGEMICEELRKTDFKNILNGGKSNG